jgi:hypothetical protein
MHSLADMLDDWEDGRARGKDLSPEELCPDDPVRRAKLAAKIRDLIQFDRDWSPPPVPDLDTERPDRIGKFEILDVLDAGGMGVVYLARDPGSLKRDVAIKVIQRGQLSGDAEQALSRFDRECGLLANLRHPNVVTVYEAGHHAGAPYMVMEYLKGGTLAKARETIAAGGPLALAKVVEKVAKAVHAAHACGITHRDLKPANVLLDENGEPKLVDFGLAKRLAAPPQPAPPPPAPPDQETKPDEAEARGRPTVGGGTEGYMAPEQRGEPNGPTPAVDVWALGVVLHEMLTGVRPTAAKPDPREVAKAVGGPLGRRLAAITDRCLQTLPADRYGSAGELAEELAALPRLTRRAAMVRLGAAVAAVGAIGAAGAEAMAPTPPGVMPDARFAGYANPEAVAKALDDLASGQKVELIGPDRPTPPHRWLMGPMSGKLLRRDGQVVLHSEGVCGLELLPSLPPGEWEVEATLRHTQTSDLQFGACGAFVGRNWDVGPAGLRNFYASALYSDFYTTTNKKWPHGLGRVVTELTYLAESWTRPYDAYPDRMRRLTFPLPKEGTEKPPRRLTFALRGGAVTAHWDGQPVSSYPAAELAACENLQRRQQPDLSAVFTTAGGVGVFVRFGQVEVVRFVVRPRRVVV